MKRTAIILLLLSMVFCFSSCAKTFKKGTITSTTYESKFLNLKFTIPEGYTFKTEEASEVIIAEDVNDYFSSTVFGTTKHSVFYEMHASSTTNTYPTVAVTLEELPDSDMTIEEYAKSVENASVADEKYTIAGKEYIKITYNKAILNGTNVTREAYCRIQDGYLVSIKIQYTTDTADRKDTLLNAFTALK